MYTTVGVVYVVLLRYSVSRLVIVGHHAAAYVCIMVLVITGLTSAVKAYRMWCLDIGTIILHVSIAHYEPTPQ